MRHRFRVDVAIVAQRQTGDPRCDPPPLVHPIVTGECTRCQWWEHCRPQLHPDDVSLRIDKGPLDVREISSLRRHGIAIVTDLAALTSTAPSSGTYPKSPIAPVPRAG